MKFIDFFAGIGGFRRGMELAGHECVGFCEFDKFATASYTSMHLLTDSQRKHLESLSIKRRQKEILKEEYRNGEWYANDIRRVHAGDIPKADCWCFGFPCQDISVAGKQLGFQGNRSSLFFRVMYLIGQLEEEDRPAFLFIENVKNLLSVNGGWDFARLLIEMEQNGYDAKWQVLNSKDFGVPQNRERVFIIANLRSRGGREILPLCGENAVTLNQLVGGMQGYRVYGTDGISATLVGNAGGVGAKTGLYLMGNLNPSGHGQGGNVYHEDGIAPTVTVNKGCGTRIFIDQSNHAPKLTENARCITARYTSGMVNHTAMNSAVMEVHPVLTPERMGKRQNGRRMKEDGEPMFTLTGQDRHGVAIEVDQPEDSENQKGIYVKFPNRVVCYAVWYEKYQCYIAIRKLTPKECFRLQGWTDDYFEKAAFVSSDSQLYKQAGNGVTVNVIYEIAKRLKE